MVHFRFHFIPPAVLAPLREARHAEYLQQVGLTDFVFGVDWETRSFPDPDMIGFIQNFDREQMQTCVRGVPIEVSVDSMKKVFKLPVCGQPVEQKACMYSPRTFPATEKRPDNGSYKLNCCTDEATRERLEFQGAAHHMRESKLDAAAYQIKHVEESLGDKNWGEYFRNKFVDALSRARDSGTCILASHLQAILAKQLFQPVPAPMGTLPLETTHVSSWTIEDGAPEQGNESNARSTLLEVLSDEMPENGREKGLELFQPSRGRQLEKCTSTTFAPDQPVSLPVESQGLRIICSCTSSSLHLTGVVEKLEREQRCLQGANERMAAMLAGFTSRMDTISHKQEYLAKEVREKPSEGSKIGMVAGPMGPTAEQSKGPSPAASRTLTVHPPPDVVASYGMTLPATIAGPVGQRSDTNPDGGKTILELVPRKRKRKDLVEDRDVRQNAKLEEPMSQSEERLHWTSDGTEEQEIVAILESLPKKTQSSGFEEEEEEETDLPFRPTLEEVKPELPQGAHVEEAHEEDELQESNSAQKATQDTAPGNSQAEPVARMLQKKIIANMPGLEVTVKDAKKYSCKPKLKWTDAEVKALREAVDKHGPFWATIKQDPTVALKERDQGALKDKWQNLARHEKRQGG